MKTQIFYAVTAALLFLLEIVYVRYARKTSISAVAETRNLKLPLVPTSGGFVVCLAVAAYTLFSYFQGQTIGWRMPLGCMVLGIMSAVDDHRPLSPILRLAVQVAVVSFTFWTLVGPYTFHYYLLLLLLGTGMINAYNFMDGINGMLVLYSVVLLGSLYVWLTWQPPVHLIIMPYAQISGTLLVLLIAVLILGLFNVRGAALVFAGDVGSITLGYSIMVIMACMILGYGDASILVFLALYAVDTVYTIFRRLFEGERIMQPHRKHLYQVLLRRGVPQLKISVSYAAAQLAINVIYFLLPPYLHWAYVIVVTAVLTPVYFIVKGQPGKSA